MGSTTAEQVEPATSLLTPHRPSAASRPRRPGVVSSREQSGEQTVSKIAGPRFTPRRLGPAKDAEWEVAAARDQEAATLTDLGTAALAAADQAVQQTITALDEAEHAAVAAEAAREA